MTKQLNDWGITLSKNNARKFTQRLKKSLANKNIHIKLSECSEILAHTVGVSNWHELASLLDRKEQNQKTIKSPNEILNILSELDSVKLPDDLIDTKKNQKLSQVINLMQNVEFWVVNDKDRLSQFKNVLEFCLLYVNTSQMVRLTNTWFELLHNLPTQCTIDFAKATDTQYPGLGFHYLMEAIQEKTNPFAELYLDRIKVFYHLDMLKEIYSPIRERLLTKLIENSIDEKIIENDKDKNSDDNLNYLTIVSKYPKSNPSKKSTYPDSSDLKDKMERLLLDLMMCSEINKNK